MGKEFELVCQSCGCNQHLMIGSGMMYSHFTLEEIHKMARGKVKEAVAQLLSESLVTHNSCTEALLTCPKCQTLTSRFSFELFDKKGNCIYQSQFNCSKCKTALNAATQEPTNYHCRYCYSPSLSYGDLCGRWD